MRSIYSLAPIIVGLVVVLTYFLVQGTTIDTPRRERADAIQALLLYNAALQRDVLLARAGLLQNYDPLVASTGNLVAAAAALPGTIEVTSGDERADFERKIGDIVRAVGEQETLVEAFKSDNALLQNSLFYFNHLSGRLTSDDDRHGVDIKAEVGLLTTAMLSFVQAPGLDATRKIEASLDRVERLAGNLPPADNVRSLVSHARLIVATLPDVDDRVARLQAAPTRELARVLQEAYLAAHARVAARADIFMVLLYAAALGLVVYIARLFVRLRANARVLSDRLEFERLIASISTQFINLPYDKIRIAIDNTLGQLAEQVNVSGARIIVFRGTEADPASSYSHQRVSANAAISPERMLELVRHWTETGYERQGCLCIAEVEALPDGGEKAALRSTGLRSLLCIPMRIAGECLGVLVLHDAEARYWHDNDISLLRTAAEIFANAIARERNETEREELQAQLNRSQRLEAIGTLAGGIAHEFNNILGAVRGYSEMALAALTKDSRARRHVQQIMKAGERAQDIVEQVLAFGRPRDRKHRPVTAGPVIAEAVDLVRASLPATLSLQTDLAARDAVVMGDPTELQQVVMNLCTNAAQAMEGRGVLAIGLDTIAAKHTLGLSHGSLPAGRYVRLAVKDRGHGIDRAIMERIFEPFFTTKRPGQGTGLGLSTVHGIVSTHQGAINVKSRPGKGTTFEVYFPWAEQQASREGGSEAPVGNGHGETVLVVDDDKPLVQLCEELLAALGYEPVGFDKGCTALAAFRADPQRFDLVLTDEIMPDVTGTELAGAMRDIRPDIPIVLMTGYDRELRPDRLRSVGIRDVLKKPLLSRPLAVCLRRHLAAR